MLQEHEPNHGRNGILYGSQEALVIEGPTSDEEGHQERPDHTVLLHFPLRVDL